MLQSIRSVSQLNQSLSPKFWLVRRRLTSSYSSIASSLPPGSWDSHMHVTDPTKFPISSSATYTPHAASLEQALVNASRLSLPNLVLVQPSTYGIDNSCLLDALEHMTPAHGRGVVVFDPKITTLEQLWEWHGHGVRGVRVNLKSVGTKMESMALQELLRRYMEAIRPLKTWALQLFVDLSVADQLEPIVDELDGVKLVIDHLGSPAEVKDRLPDMAGWESLRRMMRNENVFVKVSAPYRISKDPQYQDLEGLTKALLDERGGDGVVFASDWPHTKFEGVNVQPWVERCLEWCQNDKEVQDKLFRDNARVLWDVS
ncbi:hypothetical protein MMC11_007086 [Xylographa trunciseda]|nr:hypothetical protein [Xylographa trunciseda]